MYNLDLSWHSFNVAVPVVQAVIATLTLVPIVGTSCNSSLQVHFETQPSQEELDAAISYWESLTVESVEATSYKTQVQINEEAAASKAALLVSAKIKLALLGLSDAEIDALLR